MVTAAMVDALPATVTEISLTGSDSEEWPAVLTAINNRPKLHTLKLDRFLTQARTPGCNL